MTPTTVLLRLACVLWLQDPCAVLSAEQRTWLTQRLKQPRPLTAREQARLAPALSAWAGRKGYTAVLAALEDAPHAAPA